MLLPNDEIDDQIRSIRVASWAEQLMGRVEKIIIAATTLAATAAAMAAETLTYKYDSRGRLVKIERSGNVNNNVNTSYTYDKADNRTNKTVTGK